MPDEEKPILGHFATYRLAPEFWELGPDSRQAEAMAWLEGIRSSADVTQLYLTQGIESDSDVLVWTTAAVDDVGVPARFFKTRAAADNAARHVAELEHVLWGMTRPSQYSRAKSAQEIDPYDDDQRTTYLVMYPFTKTADWYLKGRDTRQGMMNEHIRIGKQFADIKQLLLYSFGLQDQEFVVVYETEDLELFSKLVYDLRDTEARIYTKADTPLHTAVRLSPDEWAAGLSAATA
ncbi:MAG: chlorite dismutase [Gemmatimonadetes bacterium]|nr:chlorite dismutase family protein [Gemmatimonadota bacterium]NNF11617.1 chlorite dismutase [Gemmatimonadota bacterium]